MNCKRVDKLLIRYLEGDLEKGLKSLLEKHLKDCKQCQKEFFLLRQILETVKSEKVSSPSEDYWAGYVARLWQKIEEKTPATARTAFRKGWVEYIFRWAAPVFVSLFLFIVYFYPILKTKKPMIPTVSQTERDGKIMQPAITATAKTKAFTPKAGISRQSTLIKLALPLPESLLLADRIYEYYNPSTHTTEVIDEVYAQVVDIENLLFFEENKDYLGLIDELTNKEKRELIVKIEKLL